MNIVDIVILSVVGVSMLFGLYRGFISTVLNTGCAVGSVYLGFHFAPRLAQVIAGNSSLVNSLLNYTDAASRVGDQTLSLTSVSTLTPEALQSVMDRVNLPEPLNTLLRDNLSRHIFQNVDTVREYVSNTILSGAINVICFLLCFAAAYLVLSIVVNLLRSVFHFPKLKQLDWLLGAAFGLARGALICFALFAAIPLIQTMVPLDMINDLLAESQFAHIFNNGTFFLSIMNGRL